MIWTPRRADGLVQLCADYLTSEPNPGVKIEKDYRKPEEDGELQHRG